MRTLASFVAALIAGSSTSIGWAQLKAVPEEAPGEIDLGEDLHVLLIGISTYGEGRPNLPGVERDIAAIEKALLTSLTCADETRCSMRIVTAPTRKMVEEARGNWRIFRSESSTSRGSLPAQDLLTEIDNFFDRLQGLPRARGILYYAGHGTRCERLNKSYLIASDTELGVCDQADPTLEGGLAPNGLEPLSERTAPLVSLEGLRRRTSDVSRILVVVDACFASIDGVFADSRRDVAELLARPGRIFLTSIAQHQRAPDESLFRQAFVDALAGRGDENHDGYLTGTEIGRYIQSRARAEGWTTTPSLRRWAGGGDIVFHLAGREAPRRVRPRRDARVEVLPECPLGCPEVVRIELRDLATDFGATTTSSAPTAPAHICVGPSPDEAERYEPWSHGLCKREFTPEDHPCHKRRAAAAEVCKGRRLFLPKRGHCALLVSKHEITFNQWDACHHEGHCSHWADDHGWGRGDQPVIDVSFEDALAYTRYLSEKTGQAYRLLRSDEWEAVARAGRRTRRWWGEALTPDPTKPLASCWSCQSRWDGRRPAPVGMFPAHPLGLHDLLGNVWEWTCADERCVYSELRGGSFATEARGVRSAVITWQPRTTRRETIGFRVARDLCPAR